MSGDKYDPNKIYDKKFEPNNTTRNQNIKKLEVLYQCSFCKMENIREEHMHYALCKMCQSNSEQMKRDMRTKLYHGVAGAEFKTDALYKHKGDKCWNCYFDNRKALIFVHKETNKSISPIRKICLKMETLLDMIRDYILLCRNCHSIR